MNSSIENTVAAAQYVAEKAGSWPTVGIILGTGLGGVTAVVASPSRVDTSDIPFFPPSTVDGHAGAVVLGRIGNVDVAILSGRVHLYEGYDPSELGFGVRVLHRLGCRTLIVTNAAGGLNPDFRPGDVMAITDHISLPSLAGRGPLVGFRPTRDLRRFVDLTDAYSPELRRKLDLTATTLGLLVKHGIYVQVGGPNFETPAEVRFLRTIGGDAVGMSTAPEVIVARQLGMDVLGLSIISNAAAGLPGALLSHDDVMQAMALAAPVVTALIKGLLDRLER